MCCFYQDVQYAENLSKIYFETKLNCINIKIISSFLKQSRTKIYISSESGSETLSKTSKNIKFFKFLFTISIRIKHFKCVHVYCLGYVNALIWTPHSHALKKC